METIQQRIVQCRRRVEESAARGGRSASDITIVCVTKQAESAEVAAAIQAGISDVGENRVQEAEKKYRELRSILDPEDFQRIRWHLIGHLQSNKAAKAARLFNMIQSVDSRDIAGRINSSAAATGENTPRDVLVQVNISGEESKFGVSWNAVEPLIREIMPLPFIRVRGLMGIGPLAEDPAAKRACFRRLREVFDRINRDCFQDGMPLLSVLSMGMSDDYEIAVEEGATMIRLGRVIFGG
ncbi:MAG: YggS family pyridoxal phosphate-dependent enzyme [Candidatus Omnitrophica bacterium]|jgi:pyridoxal phosphate enzyme, YggS family|nr:YggS family pyridoxal phosphate-dependent enzyme [Candidatus Omnitrophota bacterium]